MSQMGMGVDDRTAWGLSSVAWLLVVVLVPLVIPPLYQRRSLQSAFFLLSALAIFGFGAAMQWYAVRSFLVVIPVLIVLTVVFAKLPVVGSGRADTGMTNPQTGTDVTDGDGGEAARTIKRGPVLRWRYVTISVVALYVVGFPLTSMLYGAPIVVTIVVVPLGVALGAATAVVPWAAQRERFAEMGVEW